MPEDFADPYLDEKTGILTNLVGATTYDELANAEGELVAARIGEFISASRTHMSGTIDDFKRIHQYLFQDIFPWAGEIRTVEIRKSGGQSEFFLPSANISTGFAWAQAELAADGMLAGMPKDLFVERLAYHYDNYNFIHPFREGNGRTQRLFWSCLCHDAGFALDWRKASGEENDEASRLAAEDRDYSALELMLGRISVPCNPEEPISAGLFGTGHLNEPRR